MIWDQDHNPHRLIAASFDVLVEMASDDKHAGCQDYTRVILQSLHMWSTPLAFAEALAVRARVMATKLYLPNEGVVSKAKRRLLRIVVVYKYALARIHVCACVVLSFFPGIGCRITGRATLQGCVIGGVVVAFRTYIQLTAHLTILGEQYGVLQAFRNHSP